MRNTASCPALVNGAYVRWSDDPVSDLGRTLGGLRFKPVLMHISIESDIWAAAKVLELQVPDRCDEGVMDVAPGVTATYRWGSIDGRATEWLHLCAPFNARVLGELVAKLATAMRIKRRHDLQIVLSSETGGSEG